MTNAELLSPGLSTARLSAYETAIKFFPVCLTVTLMFLLDAAESSLNNVGFSSCERCSTKIHNLKHGISLLDKALEVNTKNQDIAGEESNAPCYVCWQNVQSTFSLRDVGTQIPHTP